MRSRLLQSLMVATVVASLNGCGDLPVVGDLGATLSGLTAPVMTMLDPVIGRFFPKEEPPPPPPRPRPRPRRRTVAVANPGVVTPGATDSPETQVVTQPPAAAYVAWSERNRRFDKLRTDGLMQLYNGQTAHAIQSFKEAQSLRPEDPTIRSLVALAQNPGSFKSETPGLSGAGAPPAIPQPAAPAVPPGATGALNQLFKGIQGAQGAPTAPSSQGDQPGGLF